MFVKCIFLLITISQVTSECLLKKFQDAEVKFCPDSILYKNCTCNGEEWDELVNVLPKIGDCRIQDNNEWKLSDVRAIRVSDTIQELRQSAFLHLTNLRALMVSLVELKHLHSTSFINLPNITTLIAAGNNIRRISYGVFTGKRFKLINLVNNDIAEIEEDAFSNMRLGKLFLANNRLKSINKNWFHGSRIDYINFAFNFITIIRSDTFENLPQLSGLDISFNEINTIQENAFKGMNIQTLSLSGNNLTNFDFGCNISVQFLRLELNRITSLSDRFLNSLQNLRKLSIFPNPLLCHCLNNIEEWARMKGIKLNKYDGGYVGRPHFTFKETLPLCIFPEIVTLNLCNNNDERNYRLGMESYFNVVNYAPDIISYFKNIINNFTYDNNENIYKIRLKYLLD